MELTWSGPGVEHACIGGEGLTRAVNEYLGRHAISSPPAELALHVRVERLAKGWRALIRLQDRETGESLGERELTSEGPLCSGLDEALKLSVALLVDDELAEVGAARTAPPKPELVPEPPREEPDDEIEPNEEPDPFEPPPWRFALDASLVVEHGVLPSLATGLDLGFEAAPADWLALRAHAVGFVPQTRSVGMAEAQASLLQAGIALCPRSELQQGWTVQGCFGIDAGRLGVDRTGFTSGRDVTRRLLMASAGVRLALRLSPHVGVTSQFTALFPARQDRFVVEIDGASHELFQVAQVAWVAGLGVSYTF